MTSTVQRNNYYLTALHSFFLEREKLRHVQFIAGKIYRIPYKKTRIVPKLFIIQREYDGVREGVSVAADDRTTPTCRPLSLLTASLNEGGGLHLS